MHIERKDIDTLNAELHINIAPSDYAERVDNAIKKHRKTMQMPGFRPGHVPMTLVKQRFGKSILAEEINQVIQSNLYKFLSENKIEIFFIILLFINIINLLMLISCYVILCFVVYFIYLFIISYLL